MNWLKNLRPTPALIVAMAALVAAMSGAAIALPGKGTVSTNDIEKAAITQKLIARGAVGSQQIIGKSIRGNRLKDGAVRAKQIADATITAKQIADAAITKRQVATDGLDSTNISDLDVIGDGSFVKVTATEAPTLAGAQAAAPETVLFSKGQLTIYAKCFRDTTAGEIRGNIYARASANGAILQGAGTNLPNNDATLLDTTTTEDNRTVDMQATTNPNSGTIGESEGVVIGADGTDLHILSHIAVKQGSIPGGNGAFGAGDVCLFGGQISG